MNLRGVPRAAWLASLLSIACAGTAPGPPPPATPPPAPPKPPVATRIRDGDATDPAVASVFLGHMVIRRTSPGKIGGSTGATLTIQGTLGAPSLRELKRRGVHYARKSGSEKISLQGYPRSHDKPTAHDLAASFVIDADSDEVQGVKRAATEALGAQPTMVELTGYVAKYIEHKDLAREYDPASVVARRREGDCTEHAVLLAALGRSFGFATRVMHGLVLVDLRGGLTGGGHAWVEWAGPTGWEVADAAIGAELDPLYLPLQMLTDESPSFGRHLLLTMPANLGIVTVAPP